jgi:hypothetical protein
VANEKKDAVNRYTIYKNNLKNWTFLIVFLTFIQTFDNKVRIQIRSGTGSGFIIKIYGSGFESRRPAYRHRCFLLTPAFLTDTSISYWHRCSLMTPAFLTDTGVPYWHWHFLLSLVFLSDTGVFFLTLAFLTGTGVFYWHRRFLLSLAFLSDTGVSYWHRRSLLTLAFLTDTGVSYWHRRFLLTLAFLTDTGVSYWPWRFLLIPAFLTDTGVCHTVAGVIPKTEPLRQAPQQPLAAPRPVATPLWLSGQLPKSEYLNSMYGERNIFL